jgi:hypothetical protein
MKPLVACDAAGSTEANNAASAKAKSARESMRDIVGDEAVTA